jgi:hypothetical protein
MDKDDAVVIRPVEDADVGIFHAEMYRFNKGDSQTLTPALWHIIKVSASWGRFLLAKAMKRSENHRQ